MLLCLVVDVNVGVFGVLIKYRYFFPFLCAQLNKIKINRGLIRTNFLVMILLMTACWLWMLSLQCFYFGMDPTFRFEWIRCANDENATWNGGFDWDC